MAGTSYSYVRQAMQGGAMLYAAGAPGIVRQRPRYGSRTRTTFTKNRKRKQPGVVSLKSAIRSLESAQHSVNPDSVCKQTPVLHNTVYTHNVTAQVILGTGNNLRTNETIYLDAIKLNAWWGSSAALTLGQKVRVSLYWADYTYNGGGTSFGTGIGLSAFALQTAGGTSTGTQLTPNFLPDPKKITMIYDEIITVNQQTAATSDVESLNATVPLKRSFNYTPQTVYGSDRNLYLMVCAASVNGSAGVTNQGDIYISYDMIFRNSK